MSECDRDPPPLDWRAWHADYDAETPLRRRLAIVQKHIRRTLDAEERSPVKVISMCAGEARDLLGVLANHRRRDVRGRLVEIDPQLASIARRRAADLGLRGLEVATTDAARTSAYAGAIPADLVLVCGVFGNISDEDVETTIRALPSLCSTAATVIWTRHRRPPDLTVRIRRWLKESSFEEIDFEHVPDSPGSVGVAQFRGQTQRLADRLLFRFIRTTL